MSLKLLLNAFVKFTLGILMAGMLIFIPAGTLLFPSAWLLIKILFIPMFFAGIIMMLKNPELLKKRLEIKENQTEQKYVVAASSLIFIIGFIIAGLNFRFKWHILPKSVIITASIVFIVSYILFGEVLRENTFVSRTIKIEKNQIVIDTGLYSVVRHPMYSASILMFLSIPLILGSLYSFVVFLIYPVLIIIRISGEEKLLKNELTGYNDYMKKVKYRLIPYIW